jgi:Cytochrome P450
VILVNQVDTLQAIDDSCRRKIRLPLCSAGQDFLSLFEQVPVGMSAYLMHSDPTTYPKPSEFIPERWLGEVDHAMYRNFVPFCRGSHNCLGMK